ncbi:unnamed protein product [Parajaminaea phylloscopi]
MTAPGPGANGNAKRPPRLDLSAMPPTKSTASNRPKSVTLVVSGSAPWKAIDALATKWHGGGDKALDVQGLGLRALVYELGHGDKGVNETPDLFQAGREAPTHLPITVVQPLTGVPPKLPEAPQAPPHSSLSFTLATIQKKEDLAAHQQEWLDVLRVAGERKYTLEFAIRSPEAKAEDAALEEIRDQFEEILGKAYTASGPTEDSSIAGGSETGYFLVFDQFASPPLHLASSQLLRSQELADWAKFIGRLALHPRVYLKLSPFALSSLVRSSLLSQTRTADYTSSTAQSATDAATHLASTAESVASQVAGADEPSAELKRRLRIFLDVVLEAFGVDRLIWGSNVGAGHSTAGALPGSVVSDAEAAVKEWYEVVREGLAGMGLDEDSLENIFSTNASRVYRI